MLKKLVGWPLMTLLLAACVTINIYFPAAAAEEAARTIVRDVLGGDSGSSKQDAGESGHDATTPGDDQSSEAGMEDPVLGLLGHVLEWAVPPAAAAQVDINIDSPAIRKLRSSMASRQSGLSPYYRAGAIGFDQNGLVAVRDLGGVQLKDRNRMKKLVADENRDRNALYREIARANGHPEWERDIRKTFARVWVEEAGSGYWYKNSGGNWVRK